MNPGVMETVDARTKLAGSNQMEILLFGLGSNEIFGINVFKVREVCLPPKITLTPNAPSGVEGVVSMRGTIIPVIALSRFLPGGEEGRGGTMVVTEYNRHTQGFLVHDVDRIIRVDWDKIRPPQNMLAGEEALVTAVTELPDGRLVSILDVEKILADVIGIPTLPELPELAAEPDAMVFFADDSAVARKEIAMVLERLGVRYFQANDGQEAWERLQELAVRADGEGVPLSSRIRLILADIEMPRMDGYVLTRHIKSDRRFEGIPVVMHSSLSTEANRDMGQRVGADGYVGKFDPLVLAETLRPYFS
jgi:two-component system chemotaxis response regulator CheV